MSEQQQYLQTNFGYLFEEELIEEIQKIGAKHTRGIHFWLKFRVQSTRDGTILASFIYNI